jgi:hypothetical protein
MKCSLSLCLSLSLSLSRFLSPSIELLTYFSKSPQASIEDLHTTSDAAGPEALCKNHPHCLPFPAAKDENALHSLPRRKRDLVFLRALHRQRRPILLDYTRNPLGVRLMRLSPPHSHWYCTVDRCTGVYRASTPDS